MTREPILTDPDRDPAEMGDRDNYYGDPPRPRKYVNHEYVELTDPNEIRAYFAAYDAAASGEKVW